MTKKHYHYYYFDEQNDDFANTNIQPKPTPENWVYLPKNIFYKVFKTICYYTILPIASLLIINTKQHNKKILKNNKNKKLGYFIYGNHTTWLTDAISGHLATFPKQTYIIVNPDAINIKGIRWLVKCGGALPTPEKTNTFINFLSVIDELYNKGNPVVIYPESHIWPKYNKIRDFKSVSFHYPAKLNAPCFSKTTIYKKQKNGKTKPEIYYDGPFYPDMSLPLKEREKKLRNDVYNQMQKRIAEQNSQLDINFEYTKVDSKDNVRTEIYKTK